MCGIGGILRIWPPGTSPPPPLESIPESWLDTIDQHIKHRGPDGQGRFRDRATRPDGSTADVALVHRRLGIIDLAGGSQPMVSEGGRSGAADGLVAVVFNGCIYNHRDLRAELQRAGHHFVTDHSDTEVLLHGWREWRTKLFGKIVAMGAMAIWDRALGSIVMHRTAPGEKPLYRAWSEATGITAFASTPAALIRLARQVSLTRLHDPVQATVHWIAFGHGPNLMPLAGIDQMPYGIPVCPDAQTQQALGLDIEEDSRLPGDPEHCDPSTPSTLPREPQALAAHVDELLSRAVSRRLEADVPICCLLSGGVDSSLIAHYASQATPRLSTLCVKMPDARYDESEFANIVAAKIGSNHRTITAGGKPAQDLVHLIHQLGLPFGDSSLLPTFWACRAAADQAKVLLTGDGGDEVFYGYERYIAADRMLAFRQLARLVPLSLLPRQDPKSRADKFARFVTAARHNSYTSLLAIFQHPDLAQLLGEQAKLVGWGLNFSGASSARADDLRHNLESDMLRKVDTASMSIPVEARSPMLDQVLLQELAPLTPSQGMPRGQRKGLLRAVARRYFPSEVVDRPKMGFAIPIGEWFRTDYGGMKSLLLDHLTSADPWPNVGVDISRRFVMQMLDEHAQERRDHSQRLYTLLVLSIWAKAVLA